MTQLTKEDWQKSYDTLKVYHDKLLKDLEEQEYMLECYLKKINDITNKGGTQ